jgi:hypothetical protein
MDNEHSLLKSQLADSSRALADLTSNMLNEHPELLKSLLEICWEDEEPWCMRASRIVSIRCCRYPEMVKPYTSEIINHLPDVQSESVLRNLLKIFMDHDIKMKKSEKSTLLNLCFDCLSGSYSAGVKVYSMDILFKLTVNIPELQRELYAIIEDQLKDASAGFISRGNKVLQKILKA